MLVCHPVVLDEDLVVVVCRLKMVVVVVVVRRRLLSPAKLVRRCRHQRLRQERSSSVEIVRSVSRQEIPYCNQLATNKMSNHLLRHIARC